MSINPSPDRSDVVDSVYVSSRINVGSTEVEAKVGASRATGRQIIILYNDGNKEVFCGPTGVSATGSSKGVPLGIGETMSFPIGDQLGLFMIVQSGTTQVVVQEIG